jgi:hypothetical protein
MFGKYGKELQTATILIEKRNNEIIELKDRIAELERENKILDKVVKYNQELIENGKLVSSEQLKQFAERIKMEFYYEFDELIPSIMSDKIDKILKEIIGE